MFLSEAQAGQEGLPVCRPGEHGGDWSIHQRRRGALGTEASVRLMWFWLMLRIR